MKARQHFHFPVLGAKSSSRGPSYSNEDARVRLCYDSEQCRLSLGEVCWWFYDGCERGECVCDPRRYTPGPDGSCIPSKKFICSSITLIND